MKIGVELKIDVTKIDKARLFVGKKGKYLDMTVFIDIDEKDQYENNGMITHKKLEGEERSPILGNCKVFWKGDGLSQQPQQNNAPQQPQDTRYNQAPQQQQNNAPQQMAPPIDDLSDDAIPF